MEVGAGACPPAPGRARSFKYIQKEKISELTFSVRKELITENYFNVA